MIFLQYNRLTKKNKDENTLIDIRTTKSIKKPKKYFAKLEKINNELIVNVFNGHEITLNGTRNFYDTHSEYFQDFKNIKKQIEVKKIAVIKPNNKVTVVATTLEIIDIGFLNSMSNMGHRIKRDQYKHAVWLGNYSGIYPVYKNSEFDINSMLPTNEISIYGRQPKYGIELNALNLYEDFFNSYKNTMQFFTWKALLDWFEKSLDFFFPIENHKMKMMSREWCINQCNIFFDEKPFDSILLFGFAMNVENFQIYALNRFNGIEQSLPDEAPSKKFFPQLLKQLNANLYDEKSSLFDQLLFSKGGPYRPMKYGYVVLENGEKVELY